MGWVGEWIDLLDDFVPEALAHLGGQLHQSEFIFTTMSTSQVVVYIMVLGFKSEFNLYFVYLSCISVILAQCQPQITH